MTMRMTTGMQEDYNDVNKDGGTAQGGGGSFKNRKRIGEIDCCE